MRLILYSEGHQTLFRCKSCVLTFCKGYNSIYHIAVYNFWIIQESVFVSKLEQRRHFVSFQGFALFL